MKGLTPTCGRWIGIGITVLGLFVLLIASTAHDNVTGFPVVAGIFFAIGIVIAVFGLIFSAVYWMCPSCGSFLPSRTWFSEYCHRCGESLDTPRFGG